MHIFVVFWPGTAPSTSTYPNKAVQSAFILPYSCMNIPLTNKALRKEDSNTKTIKRPQWWLSKCLNEFMLAARVSVLHFLSLGVCVTDLIRYSQEGAQNSSQNRLWISSPRAELVWLRSRGCSSASRHQSTAPASEALPITTTAQTPVAADPGTLVQRKRLHLSDGWAIGRHLLHSAQESVAEREEDCFWKSICSQETKASVSSAHWPHGCHTYICSTSHCWGDPLGIAPSTEHCSKNSCAGKVQVMSRLPDTYSTRGSNLVDLPGVWFMVPLPKSHFSSTMKELCEKGGDGNNLASADRPALLDPILLQRTLSYNSV